MRRTALILCCGLASPALATTDITPKASDPQIATAAYMPDRFVPLQIPKGQTVVISVGDKVEVTETYGADGQILAATIDTIRHSVSIHSDADTIDPPRLYTIIGIHLPDHATYRYRMKVSIAKPDDPKDPPDFSLIFTYPDEVRTAQAVAWRAAAAAREQKADEAALQRAQQAQSCTGQVNNHYALQGATQADWDLLPTREVCDDGQNTYFHFPGNMSVPLIYKTDDQGKEMLADYSFNSISRVAIIHSLARTYHLHSGTDKNSLLCVFNRAYDPIGKPVTNDTVSPDIHQVPR